MTARVTIQTAAFDLAAEVEALRAGDGGVGAVVSFVGTVRDRDGAQTGIRALELEHYPGMTERAIEAMIDQAMQRFDVRAARVVHRVGRLAVGEQIVLVGLDRRPVQPLQPVDRRPEADGAGHVRRAGLELVREAVVERPLEGDREDHVPAALPGGHLLEARGLAPEDADAGRPEDLVAGEDEEVSAERLYVDRHVRDSLRSVEEHPGAVAMGHRDHLPGRGDRAERIGHLREGDELRLRAEELLVLLQDDLPAVVDGRQALKSGAPQLHDIAPNNTCYVWGLGDKSVEAAQAIAAATGVPYTDETDW